MERLVNKFKNAFNGLVEAFKIDSSVRLQYLLATITLIASLLLRLTLNEWMVVLICIGLVLSAELLNTAIEKTLDNIHDFPDDVRKNVKDISAGAVLVVSIVSLIIMILILVNKGANYL